MRYFIEKLVYIEKNLSELKRIVIHVLTIV